MSKHTPITVDVVSGSAGGMDGRADVTFRIKGSGDTVREFHAFIVTACNAHDELIAAVHHTHLEWLRSTSERDASVRLEELGKDAAALLANLEVGHD